MGFVGFVDIITTSVVDTPSGGRAVEAVVESSSQNSTTAESYGHHGLITRPAKKVRGVRLRIGKRSFVIAATGHQIEPPINPGETSLYATNEDGAEQVRMDMCHDGKVVLANQAESFAKLVEELITELAALQTTGSPANHVLNATTINKLNALKGRFAALFKEAR